MSSIFGAWDITQQPFTADAVQKVIQQTAWWQPDKKGHFHSENLFLGHQLLATKPNQEQEVQPYQDKRSGLVITADVRLDNRTDLIKLLGLNNPKLPDYQLILECYKRFGVDCVQHLIGAFAFAIWDAKEQLFFCGRDQMGEKPFNFYYHKNLFSFGTQKKSILALPGVDKTPNWRNIFNSLSNLGLPPNSTEQQHIQKLAPGHFLLLNRTGLKIKKYWELDIHQTISYKNDEEYIEHFRHLFKQAISDRLSHRQAVGAHLSGGMDSSGITAFANIISKEKGHPFHAFGYSVPRDYDEKKDKVEENLLAHDVVDFCQLANFHNVMEPIDRPFQQLIEDETLAIDGFSRSNNVNTEYELQAAAHQQGVDVVLSGFPGDELVTSFCRPYYLEYLERGHWGTYFLAKDKSRHVLKEKLQAFAAAQSVRWMPSLSKFMAQKYIERRAKGREYLANRPAINKDYFLSRPDLAEVLEPKIFPMNHEQFPTSLKGYQRNHVCRPHTARRIESETLAGLRFKVEYRYPMTDIRLLQYVLSVPVEQKISPDMTRRLYRRSMKGYLPESLRLRDVKTRGSLKPISLLHRKSLLENTKITLWENIKSHQAAPFLKTDLIDNYMETKASPYRLFHWMVLGQLGVEKKLQF